MCGSRESGKTISEEETLTDSSILHSIITSQVTGSGFEDEGFLREGPLLTSSASGGADFVPALGLAWSHCVNTRLNAIFTFHD